MRVAIVTPTMKSGERGGAEALYAGLVRAFNEAGHDADQIEVVVDESSFDAIVDSYERCAALELDAYDLVVSTKAPTYMVRHPRHVSYLLHTIRVFYDMFEREFGAGTPQQRRQRAIIHELDRQGLHPDRIRAHFANGRTTFERLYDVDPWWSSVGFEALHHPPELEGYKRPRRGRHVLLPGRLHRWKRADLVVEAFKHVKADLDLKIVGTGEDQKALQRLARGDKRIQFLGRVKEDALLELYADALVVPFVPRSEDYGLITIEAFRSRKPVITCTDSGETLAFVKDGETGCVTRPDPREIAERIDWLDAHRGVANEMGRRGFQAVSHITWDRVVEQLLAGAARPARAGATTALRHSPKRAVAQTRTTVLDMQPIDPPIGGGRLRLLGLYHGLGEDVPATYVGTYDWPGESARRVRHSDTLEEITVPLSPDHFRSAAEWQAHVPGTSVMDISFSLLASQSPEYLAATRRAIAGADVVVFSHPWVYPLVRDSIDRERQLVVYDAQNVESVLRAELLGHSSTEERLAREVTAVEAEMCRAADLILACSHADCLLFKELYGVPLSRMRVAPNGTFVTRARVPDAAERQRAKAELRLGRNIAVFVGSAYGPNVEAARFIRDRLAPAMPNVTFVICGGAGDSLAGALPPNVHAPGVVSADMLARYLSAADVAINPMFSGSGTNVKMLEFLAAGLPVVSTPAGARGLTTGCAQPFQVVEADGFAEAIHDVLSRPQHAADLAREGRRLAEESYSWERISARVGTLFARHRARLGTPAPKFSVIVATYDRHHLLPRLLDSLAAQTFKNFEVILVDQSATEWRGQGAYAHLDLFYAHTDVRGAVTSRNAGAFFARGDVLAFTDDDCVPDADWLEQAARHFDDPAVVGVEGAITTEKRHDPEYRTVTNVDFEGVGFMTANLFLRREIFCAIDGFDQRFDHPHFREDTDLAWRALAHGRIPHARNVRVFHPPHRRNIEREGHEERMTFFEKDALLFQKHPSRYRGLMVAEGHFLNTAGFAAHLRRGAQKYGVDLNLDPRVRWLAESSEVRALLKAAHE